MSVFWRKKTGFLTRLGNIIIVQVLFVFAALAIVIFYPDAESSVDSEYLFMCERLRQAGADIAAILEQGGTDFRGEIADGPIYHELVDRVKIDKLVQFYLFTRTPGQPAERIFSLSVKRVPSGTDDTDQNFADFVDREIIDHHPRLRDGDLIPIIHDSRYFVYYYQVTPDDMEPLVLVAISDHRDVTAGPGKDRYTFFLLFLVAALVSLLTVHLIRKRFQSPLDRLIRGLEKTQKGELYCLIESDLDDELSKLTQAYNNMSLTLWDNNQKLTENNTRLEEINAILRESQEFLGTLIDSSPTCIVSTNPEGEITVFNREAVRVFGIKRETAVGTEFDKLFTHKLSEIKTSKLIMPDRRSVEVLCRRGDGSLFPAYLISVPVNTRDGEVWAYLHLIKDISESKNFQEMMIRLDRYYTRGEMAGDIAHEINNFLAILQGNVELMPLLMKKNDADKIDQKLQVMRATIDRITHFTDGLLDSGGEQVRFEKADINQLVETVIAFLKPQNKFDNLSIKTNLSTDIPLVDIDTGQMQQLMVNLLRNASEAMEKQDHERLVRINTELSDIKGQPGITVTVRDNGPGVHPEKRSLLFEKRFTTKARGHGIGLITCKRIIDTHHGNISYNFDEGAVFAVQIPVKNPAATGSESAEMTAEAGIVS